MLSTRTTLLRPSTYTRLQAVARTINPSSITKSPFAQFSTSQQFKMPLIPGSTGNNRLILGLMTLGPDESKGARITSMDEYKKCLDLLSSKGYYELDTAGTYVGGLQETFTKEAGYQDRGFAIASKIYPSNGGEHSPEQLRSKWEASLEKLGTKCTDIFYLHAPDRTVPFETTLEEVDKLHKEGKFVRLGLSNYAAWEVAEIVGICERR